MGPWSGAEDDMLVRLVKHHGPRSWSVIAASIPGRDGKSCRLRWCNHLSPDVNHGPFSADEDRIIMEAHSRYGNKWSRIAMLLVRRTDNAVRNRFNSSLKRRFAALGGGSGGERDLRRPNPALQQMDSGGAVSVGSNLSVSCNHPNPRFQVPPPPPPVLDTELTLALPGSGKDRKDTLPTPPMARVVTEAEQRARKAMYQIQVRTVLKDMIRTEVRNYISKEMNK